MRWTDPDRPTMTHDDGPTSHGEPADEMALGVTIAWHPDPSRVGQRALFEGPSMAIGRLAPIFHREDGAADGPLIDPRVSRTPIALQRPEGGVLVSGRAPVDGERLTRGSIGRRSPGG